MSEQPIVSLREARERGLPRYRTGLPCKRGHYAERRTTTNTCLACLAMKRKKPGAPVVPRPERPTDWPPERDAELTRMVEVEGRTYAAIGIALGITKNAAIGRAHRMFLNHPNTQPSTKGPAKPDHQNTIQRLAALDIFPGSGECVFPIGHPRDPEFRFCGERVHSPGQPYCATCWAKSYRPEAIKLVMVARVAA